MVLPSNAHAVHTTEYLTGFHANDIKVCQMFAPAAFAKVVPIEAEELEFVGSDK